MDRMLLNRDEIPLYLELVASIAQATERLARRAQGDQEVHRKAEAEL